VRICLSHSHGTIYDGRQGIRQFGVVHRTCGPFFQREELPVPLSCACHWATSGSDAGILRPAFRL